MKKIIALFLFSLINLFSPLVANTGAEESFENEILFLMKKYQVPGVSMVIINEAKVVFHKALGVKNNKTHEALTEETIFEGASFSKPLFAYAVMQLVEQGVIDLDKPLSTYLKHPDLKNEERANLITARMVLDHTSGLPNWRPKDGPLEIYFQPGEKFSYSGEGFIYLQKVVEHLTNTPLEKYMNEKVLIPLGMQHSNYVWVDEYKNSLSFAHSEDGTSRHNSKRLIPNAAAGLHTNALEYSKFIIAFMKSVGLKPQTVEEMLTPQITIELDCVDCTHDNLDDLSQEMSWGLGWGLQKIGNENYFWHWGNNPGFKNYVFSTMDGKRSVILMTNSENGLSFISELLQKITGITQPTFKWLEAPY